MSKVRKIKGRDFLCETPPLRVTTRQAHDGKRRVNGKCSRVDARDLVRCGCCKQRLEVYYDENPIGDPNIDTLEINGVIGTVDQWRQFFLPHLGLPMPKDEAQTTAAEQQAIEEGRREIARGELMTIDELEVRLAEGDEVSN